MVLVAGIQKLECNKDPCNAVSLQSGWTCELKFENVKQTPSHLENEWIPTFPRGNFCSISPHRRWLVCEECVREQKCGFAPGWPLAVLREIREYGIVAITSTNLKYIHRTATKSSDESRDGRVLGSCCKTLSCTPWTLEHISMLLSLSHISGPLSESAESKLHNCFQI